MSPGPRGTEGYDAEADALAVRYESFSFEATHADILNLLPSDAGRVLDIGAGTGRDAAGFAARGCYVLAVEPTAAMRTHGMRLHPDPLIEWLDDSLPLLAHVMARSEPFDIVMLTAVLMHLDITERALAMPRLASLLRPGAVMAMSLRHGPVPKGRRMFEIPSDEICDLAKDHGLTEILRLENHRGPLKRDEVTWSRLVFKKI